MNDKNTTILIAAHKPYQFPKDTGYLPIHVGKALGKDLGITSDHFDGGISELNPYFCELTGLYWLWKQNNSDVYGLAHYRRYFKSAQSGVYVGEHQIASSSELTAFLKDHDIVLPKPRNYVIATIRQHYLFSHHESDLKALEQAIAKLYPDYSESFKKVFSKKTLSLYNMFVMRKADFERYSEWLFSILFEVEKNINYKNYGPYQRRVFGFMAERLLNVWVDHNIQRSKIKYMPVVNIEGENLTKKAYGMLRRMILKEKLQ